MATAANSLTTALNIAQRLADEGREAEAGELVEAVLRAIQGPVSPWWCRP